MKKVKLMLLSLSVLAVVGGALAFKAKGDTQFCSAPTIGTGTGACATTCPDFTSGTLNSGTTFICTTPSSNVESRPCKDGSNNFLQCQVPSIKVVLDN